MSNLAGNRHEYGIRVENAKLTEDAETLTKASEFARGENSDEHLLCEYMFNSFNSPTVWTEDKRQVRDLSVFVQMLDSVVHLYDIVECSTDNITRKNIYGWNRGRACAIGDFR